VRLINPPEEPYRVWCAWVWSWSLDNGRLWPTGGCCGGGDVPVKRWKLLSKRKIHGVTFQATAI